jgi:hypothetical protein
MRKLLAADEQMNKRLVDIVQAIAEEICRAMPHCYTF